MKFIHEKLDSEFILRKVHDEEARVGRRVTRVELNPREWCDFLDTIPAYRRNYGESAMVWRIPRYERLSAFNPGTPTAPTDIQVLEIVRA